MWHHRCLESDQKKMSLLVLLEILVTQEGALSLPTIGEFENSNDISAVIFYLIRLNNNCDLQVEFDPFCDPIRT